MAVVNLATILSGPASAIGGLFVPRPTSFTTISTLSPALNEPSLTVRRNVRVSGVFTAVTSGASKVGRAVVVELSVTVVPAVCDQEKVSVVPASGSDEVLPSSVTGDSSSTDWLTPAAADGARLVLPPASELPPPQAARNNPVDRTAALLYRQIRFISLMRPRSDMYQ